MYEQFGVDTPGDKGRKEKFFKQVEDVQRTQDLYDKVHKALDPDANINVEQVPRIVEIASRCVSPILGICARRLPRPA
jgi:hypothetical protein